MEIISQSGTISFGPAQYVNQYLVWHKKFGPVQNILLPVEGRGINVGEEYLSIQQVKMLNSILTFVQNLTTLSSLIEAGDMNKRGMGTYKICRINL